MEINQIDFEKMLESFKNHEISHFKYNDGNTFIELDNTNSKINGGLKLGSEKEKTTTKSDKPDDNVPNNKSIQLDKDTTAEQGETVLSPTVGIYYSSSKPGEPDYVKRGQHVNQGDVIGLIETMKMYSNITSKISGTVDKIMVSNEEAVEFNQPLMKIVPDEEE